MHLKRKFEKAGITEENLILEQTEKSLKRIMGESYNAKTLMRIEEMKKEKEAREIAEMINDYEGRDDLSDEEK